MARTAVNTARAGVYAKKEINSEDFPIDQKKPISDDPSQYQGEVVLVDKPLNKEMVEALAFNEEPVTIRLEPGTDKNAEAFQPAWVNGKGAEVFQRGQWLEITYLPIGVVLTTKRKYLERILLAKIDTITTDAGDTRDENPHNRVKFSTSAVRAVTIIEDKNPKGVDWLSELRRRNF